ncbi:tail fiber assembly protein [Hafnia alvei]|uniref:tail fiber assembly protein n=1 Tax=Hafnia alvei TaxID=569 RepID=UPI000B7624E8|nr:tail fiber assembly protein [Hafnia alvei]MBI0275316.1 tail fiber assembly protein [Hafnia alvei]PNK98681.1 phage tail protein [Hafnia alvei]
MAAFKFSNKDQTLTVYNLSSDTCELIGSGDCFVPANTGLPAFCTNLKPPKEKAGFAVVFDADTGTWQYVADHRGETRWNTQNRQMQVIDMLGDVPNEMTDKAPTSDFDTWNGNTWFKDAQAEIAFHADMAERVLKERMSLAVNTISTLQDAVDLAMATEAEETSLTAWRTYRVLLSRIDTSTAPDIDWPPIPA